MGGFGSGGAPSVGRKPKERATAVLHGSRDRTRTGKSPSPSVVLPVVDMPGDLSSAAQALWIELAPLARESRTLTAATARAFRDLCDAIVLRDRFMAQIVADGLTYEKVSVDGAGVEHVELKAHPLIVQHRGMLLRVEAALTRFRLAPIGKEIAPTEKPVDPFDEFDHDATH